MRMRKTNMIDFEWKIQDKLKLLIDVYLFTNVQIQIFRMVLLESQKFHIMGIFSCFVLVMSQATHFPSPNSSPHPTISNSGDVFT